MIIMQLYSDLVESVLQAHSVAIQQVRTLCRPASGRYWIHQRSCEALASTYEQALQKITNMLTNYLISHHHLRINISVQLQPALDMLLAAIHQGNHFLQTCRPSVTDLSKSSSIQHRGRENLFLSADDKPWLHRALLKGCASDATDVHLHDFLLAFSAVAAAIEGMHMAAKCTIGYNRMADLQVPSPDLFWRDQNKLPHVLLVSAQRLDHAKYSDDTVLNSQLESAINQLSDDDEAQLPAFVKKKIRCAKQAFHESIDPGLLDIKKSELDNSLIFSVHTTSVHRVTWLGREYALKVYKKDMEETFLQEARVHVRLHHPNVVHAVALHKGEKEYGILMELMDESLKSFLRRYADSLSLQEKVNIMLQIAKGMAYVHEKGVIHRDLKPSNVLVRCSSIAAGTTQDTSRIHKQLIQLEVKVADFGESNTRLPDSSSFTTKRIGTSVYRAPEVLNDNTESANFTRFYKRSADVYSFAMTCFELLVEEEPFHDSEKRQALWERVIRGERPDIASISDAACPPYLKHCLTTWWDDDPNTRHSFTYICCVLRHMYVCLARCQSDTQPIEQFPFLGWPFPRWRHAQDMAQQRLHEFEIRRVNEDWKDKGYFCESTRVNEIPYELDVMKWAIKKTDEPGEAKEEAYYNRDATHSEFVQNRSRPENSSIPANDNSTTTTTTAPPRPANDSTSGTVPVKSFLQKLKEFCCFTPARSILPSTHEAFHDDVPRRHL